MTQPLRFPLCIVAALAMAASVSCQKPVGPEVAASVNGHPITYADLDREYATQFANEQQKQGEDQVALRRLELLRSLIDNEIMMERAEKLSLLATDPDIDAKLSELKAPYTQEEFQKQLATRKLTLDELRTKLRKDLTIQKLFNKEITSRINITDKDVSDAYYANKGDFNLPEPQIHLAQILVTPTAESEVRNLKNDNAKTDSEAQEKIKMLAARLERGEEFGALAQNYSEDAQTAANGGDLGFVPESALEKADISLRKAIFSIPPGQVSPVLKTSEGYRIFRVISREPAGQRELNDPRVQQIIRERLLNRKDQLLKNAYYEVARNEAKVTNYLAMQVAGKK